jgi:putative hydrolase of the HAD superfamily
MLALTSLCFGRKPLPSAPHDYGTIIGVSFTPYNRRQNPILAVRCSHRHLYNLFHFSILMLKAILFDAGDTLIKMKPSAFEIYKCILEEFEIVVDEESLRQGYNIAEKYYNNFFFTNVERVGAVSKLSLNERKEVWIRYNSLVLEALGIKENKLEIARSINDRFDGEVHFVKFPETEDVLKKLDAYTLGVISNWNLALTIDEVFKTLDLSKYFSFLIASCEVGYDKPHPEIFRIGLRKASVNPDETLYVGDSYEADVVGARKVGITPILVDRHNNLDSHDCIKIKNLNELRLHLT